MCLASVQLATVDGAAVLQLYDISCDLAALQACPGPARPEPAEVTPWSGAIYFGQHTSTPFRDGQKLSGMQACHLDEDGNEYKSK